MLLGSFLCLLAVTAWGFMFPVMASALQFIDPFFFTTLRYGSAAIIFLILLLITEGKTSLRLEKNTFSILLRDSRFRGVWFSRFLRTATCRTFRSNPCSYDSIPYATDCLITAMDNPKSPPTKLYIPLYVRCITWRYACHFKGNIELLFGAASHLSTNILMLCGVTCWVIYTNGVLVFNLGHHLGTRH